MGRRQDVPVIDESAAAEPERRLAALLVSDQSLSTEELITGHASERAETDTTLENEILNYSDFWCNFASILHVHYPSQTCRLHKNPKLDLFPVAPFSITRAH